MPDAKRFWTKVNTGDDDECWEWNSTRHKKGYGVFLWNRKRARASRVAWQMTHGPIPSGMGVLHTCDNPPCCNPAHLFLGTQAANVQDMTKKGRRVDHLGEAHGRAILTERKVRDIRAALNAGQSTTNIAKAFGVSLSTISGIKTRATWKHLP